MHTLSISGAATRYWTYGDPNHPPIVMIHGFRGTHDGLDLIARELSKAFFVIVPDLPGFGDSDAFISAQHDIANYATFLHEFILVLNLTQKPLLLGHSFGSIITAQFAAKHSDMIVKLILINPIGAPALEGPKAILSRLAIVYYKLGEVLPPAVARTWLAAKPIVWLMSKVMTKTSDKSLIRYIDGQHYKHFSRFKNPRVVSEAFKASVSHTVREYAAHINLPTLLIVGDRDDITPLPKQKELVALFPHATLQIIPEVGHLVHYETPQPAADMITQFYDQSV